MRSTTDLVHGWIRKAESDLENAHMCLEAVYSAMNDER
jgi:hypothetical protein